jgi:hypothetical protein
MFIMDFRKVLLAGAVSIAFAASAHAAPTVTYIGEATFDGSGTDMSGLPSTLLEDGVSPQNGLNGFGSAIAYTGYDNRYVLLSDRGPNKVAYPGGAAVDNTTSYDNRFQIFDIDVTPNASSPTGYSVSAGNVGTTLLSNAQGAPYTGLSTGFSTNPAQNTRLDSEGIRVAPDGSIYVSDEYGPYILHFNQQGQQIGSLPVPASIQIANPGPNLAQEMATNTLGRVTNKGAEGIAISPDGKTLIAAMQGPLIQDGGNAGGTNVRLLVYDLTNPNAQPKQYLYPLDPGLAISEILAVNDHEFVVDERDGTVGGGKKLLYEIDLDQANAPTDLATSAYSGTTTANGLPVSGTPAGVTALSKTLFADVGQILTAADAFVPGTGGLPDKIEGYAWGPTLANGDQLLLATNDNDFAHATVSGFPDYIWAFDVSGLTDFQAESFDTGETFAAPAPEPASLTLLAAGLLGFGALRRRKSRAETA